MVFIEIFIGATIAAVVVFEGYLLKKICAGEELPYLFYGPVFPSRGEALALLASKRKNKKELKEKKEE